MNNLNGFINRIIRRMTNDRSSAQADKIKPAMTPQMLNFESVPKPQQSNYSYSFSEERLVINRGSISATAYSNQPTKDDELKKEALDHFADEEAGVDNKSKDADIPTPNQFDKIDSIIEPVQKISSKTQQNENVDFLTKNNSEASIKVDTKTEMPINELPRERTPTDIAKGSSNLEKNKQEVQDASAPPDSPITNVIAPEKPMVYSLPLKDPNLKPNDVGFDFKVKRGEKKKGDSNFKNIHTSHEYNKMEDPNYGSNEFLNSPNFGKNDRIVPKPDIATNNPIIRLPIPDIASGKNEKNTNVVINIEKIEIKSPSQPLDSISRKSQKPPTMSISDYYKVKFK